MSPEFVENTDRQVETDQSHRVRSYRSNAAGKRFQELKSGCQRTWSSDKPRQKALFFFWKWSLYKAWWSTVLIAGICNDKEEYIAHQCENLTKPAEKVLF